MFQKIKYNLLKLLSILPLNVPKNSLYQSTYQVQDPFVVVSFDNSLKYNLVIHKFPTLSIEDVPN